MLDLFTIFMHAAYRNSFALQLTLHKLKDTQLALIKANIQLVKMDQKPFTPKYLEEDS